MWLPVTTAHERMENSIISHRWDPIIHSTWWNAMDSMWEMEWVLVCVCVPSLHVWGWADSTHYICQRIIWEGVYYVICEASVLIMTSALFFSLGRVGKRQPVRRYPNNMKLHGNLEIEKFSLSACFARLLSFPTVAQVSDCGTEFLSAWAFCWDCIAWIVSVPLPPYSTPV